MEVLKIGLTIIIKLCPVVFSRRTETREPDFLKVRSCQSDLIVCKVEFQQIKKILKRNDYIGPAGNYLNSVFLDVIWNLGHLVFYLEGISERNGPFDFTIQKALLAE